MKKFLLLLAAVFTGLDLCAQTNLAQGKTATASTGNATLAVDGNVGTRWESTQDDDQWWSVDLGSKQKFDKIEILWEGAYGKSFDIIAGDQADFSDAVTIASTSNQVQTTFPYLQEFTLSTRANARYVKFVGIERGTGYGYSFWEFRIFKLGEPELSLVNLTSNEDYCKVGGSINFSVTATDQYGNAFSTDGITYSMSPADMGAIVGNVFTPTKTGWATITATKDGVSSNSIQIACYDGSNVASADKVIGKNEEAGDPAIAFNGNKADGPWVLYPGNTPETEAGRTYTAFFTLDLGKAYDLNMVGAYFEGASSQEYTIQTSVDGTTWQTAASVSHPAGINAWKDHVILTQNNLGVRYVKFESTKAATQYGVKLHEFEVYGLAVGGELVKDASADATTGAYGLSGVLTETTRSFFDDDHELAYDLTAVEIPAAITITATNPNALFLVTEAQAALLAGTKNLVIVRNGSYSSKNIDFIDGYDINSRLTISAETVSYTRPASYSGYQTLVVPFTTGVPSGVKAYQLVDKATGGILFQESSSLTAGTPYLIIGASGLQLQAANVTMDFSKQTELGDEASFVPAYQSVTAGEVGGNVYILDDQNTFRKAAATAVIPAFRAYITSGQALSKFDILLDEPTGIEKHAAVEPADKAGYYDLQGRRVCGVPAKGIYVHQGRKVVVR